MKWIGNVFNENKRFTDYKNILQILQIHFQLHVEGQGLDQMQRDTTTRKLPLLCKRWTVSHSVVSTNSHHAPLHGRLRQQTQ